MELPIHHPLKLPSQTNCIAVSQSTNNCTMQPKLTLFRMTGTVILSCLGTVRQFINTWFSSGRKQQGLQYNGLEPLIHGSHAATRLLPVSLTENLDARQNHNFSSTITINTPN